MKRLFGTDGVRGVANVELTPNLAFKLGQAGAYVLAGKCEHSPKILVGMDTRISGDLLESALVAGICSVGAEAVTLGIIPTPGVAYLTKLYGADAGVVISASHNPYEFNGIKFFNKDGYKLSDDVEDEIENIVKSGKILELAIGNKIGRRTVKEGALWDYVDFLKNSIDIDLKGMKIVLDCANGASYKTAPAVFNRLGADIVVINDEPDGVNINSNCGSTYMESLKNCVVENEADIGFAFDGDADRMMAVDEKGDLVDGDISIAIMGLELKKEGRLKNNTIVATVMSNLGLDIMAKKNGINLVKTKVGDRYVLEEMLANDYIIGGEQSGHIILSELNTTGDGILSALQLASIVKKSGKNLSELAGIINIFPQVLVNAKVSNSKKNDYLKDPVIAEMCKKLEDEFSGEGRVLIRASGTEPLVRVMIEGSDLDYINRKAKELADIIEERLG